MTEHKKTIKKKEGDYTFVSYKLQKFYNAYCASKKIKKQDKLDDKELRKCCAEIFREIRDHLIEKDGGVVIKKLGYFFILISKDHFAKRKGPGEFDFIYNIYKNGEIVRPVFMPAGGDKDLAMWGMDYSFTKKVREDVKENIKKGKKYKGYLFTVRRLLNLSQNETFIIKKRQDGKQ